MTTRGDDARKLVLARRARFVAAAMAGMGATACGKERATDAPPFVSAEAEAALPTPTPCLSVAVPPEPCLSVARPPPSDGGSPRPCLSVAPPRARDAGKGSGCDTPFTIGPNGEKRFKPECL